MRFSALFAACLLVPAASGAVSLFPEDGSRRMKAWYASVGLTDDQVDYEAVGKILAAEGVELKDGLLRYEWLQDALIIDEDGVVLLEAAMPADPDILISLTRGIFDSDGELQEPVLFTAQHARKLGLRGRRMKWTFVEGGELISGRFRDGRPYAIVDKDVVRRARAFYRRRGGKTGDDAYFKALVAEDLGVEPENLFPVETGGEHLDLMITALPGGRILLQDSSLTLGVLDSILAKGPPAEEGRRLKMLRRAYAEGCRAPILLASGFGPVDEAGMVVYPYDAEWEETVVADIEAALARRFAVERVAGVFNEYLLANDCVEEDDASALTGGINFFNGFVSGGKGGVPFVVTNGARGLTSLENYWRGVLSKRGIKPERVHFPGLYNDGSGLDCAGVPAPR